RDVQNKVLEAMAMARPVLVTGAAEAGIAARNGEHFAMADSGAQMAARALDLLAKPEEAARMGVAARRLVLESMSWPATLAALPQLIGRGPTGRRDAA